MLELLSKKFADLSPLSKTRDIVSFHIGCVGELVVLTRDKRDKDVFHYGVHRILPNAIEHHYAPPTKEFWRSANSLADGWYVVGDFDAEYSSRIYDQNWEVVTEIWHCGAKQLRTTQERVWIGCADAQICPAYGQPIDSGFFAVDLAGKPIFDFDTVRGKDIPPIGDCMASNVVSDTEAWLYYFGDYPLVKLENDSVANVWNDIPVMLADAVAVTDELVLFAGGAYMDEFDKQDHSPEDRLREIERQQREVLQLVELQNSVGLHAAEIELVDENGERVLPGDYIRLAWGPHLLLCSPTEVRVSELNIEILLPGINS